MRCQCLTEFGHPFVEVERPDLVASGTEVVLRVTGAGLCHSDIAARRGGHSLGNGRMLRYTDRGMKLPVVLGHEIAGVILSVGPDVGELDQTLNYAIYPWAGCGKCFACRKGNEHHCASPRTPGFHMDGGFATMIKVSHPRYLFDIGDIDPTFAATFSCSGLTSYSALKRVQDTMSDVPLVIIGAGGLGLMCISLVKALGGVAPVVVEPDAARRDAALALGAKLALDPRAEDAAAAIRSAAGGKVPAVIDFHVSEDTAALSLDLVMKGGKIILVGLHGGVAPWPLAVLTTTAVSIIGTVTGSPVEFGEFIDIVARGGVTAPPLHLRSMSELNAQTDALERGEIVGRVVLIP
ncbi:MULTISPECIES: alcohol dehydrogenase catalytic domain-containing protein [unclassified Mesorhizobium]|uniref:zinc-binding dehydrogenase n=1 Tax=unclassified Mesorhizobium TaxID=325217 RepID=UPI000FD79928|nr:MULTISPECIES: alcohol dehydrogenase catalytic domain-containing protein [unclassified Mesorhizobium]TGR23011.1 alcohol dehydrogenase [Mesorhizobium sp. M8A.F.Ca.ET.197.01.1.1]TGR39096.1 alcohol dehydrogenase [bacterium M00.F.Ca.ET.199.01.1.1]TGR46690.1 alcohol dehydrogenase [Mesorhizobium sp. M8A.F.Ca.ET.198.01.1.1]TGV85236.1 alcohol dehydrogenase [Mesorhizobium sp. M00.F.Ca.ET.149.01.1.1]